MLNSDVISDFTIAIKWNEIITNEHLLHVIHPTTSLPSFDKIVALIVIMCVRGLKNSVLTVAGGKAMATDHRVNLLLNA